MTIWENNLSSSINFAEMQTFKLDVTEDKLLKKRAKVLTEAVEGGDNLWMIYRLWRDDSKWSHATAS